MTPLVPACRTAGDGPLTLVLLHGIGGNRHVWPAQFETFVAAGHRVVAWDMPGYGESAMPAEPTMAALADSLRALLDTLGPARFVLVGHSMGGMLAQELMARGMPFTRDIAALVLCGTSPAFGKPDGDFQREFVRQRTAPLDAGSTLREMAEAIVPGMLGAPQACATAARTSAHALAVDAMGTLTPDAYRMALQALVGFEQRAALARLAVPVLLIAGEHDTNAPPKVMARMAESIAQARYVCLPGAGHLMNLTHPAAFNAEVCAFLATL